MRYFQNIGLSSLILLLSSTSFALPIEQEVKGNLNVSINGQEISLIFNEGEEDAGQLRIKTKSNQQVFSLAELPFEQSRWVYFQDYNFDGFTDIAVSSPDMGMGVYQVFNIFLYQPKTKNFKALDDTKFDFSHSKCTGFTDIKLIPNTQQMTSSCRGGARWWTDLYQFKNGQWKWLKSKEMEE